MSLTIDITAQTQQAESYAAIMQAAFNRHFSVSNVIDGLSSVSVHLYDLSDLFGVLGLEGSNAFNQLANAAGGFARSLSVFSLDKSTAAACNE